MARLTAIILRLALLALQMDENSVQVLKEPSRSVYSPCSIYHWYSVRAELLEAQAAVPLDRLRANGIFNGRGK